MRSDQFMGLPFEAIDFLAANEVRDEPCPCCKRPYPAKREVCGTYWGAYDINEHPLFRYFLTEGRVAKEFVQAEPWSSGPMFFLGLKVYDKDNNLLSEFLWSEETLNDYI